MDKATGLTLVAGDNTRQRHKKENSLSRVDDKLKEAAIHNRQKNIAGGQMFIPMLYHRWVLKVFTQFLFLPCLRLGIWCLFKTSTTSRRPSFLTFHYQRSGCRLLQPWTIIIHINGLTD
ncbi:MAG: hypothetical protein ICV79_22670 [Flavisolibacter sp.]|nr:hypothetical protein [Flavisolibacter sp.]